MKLDLDTIIMLLKEKGIKIGIENNRIFQDYRTEKLPEFECHYGIMENDQHKWDFCYFQWERGGNKIHIKETFDTKKDAVNYLFYYLLDNYFMEEYVTPARNYWIKHWTLKDVKKQMKKNHIPSKYLSDDIINPNSMHYYNSNGKWFREYIGSNGSIVAKNQVGNPFNNNTYDLSLSLNSIYCLYLFTKYEQELLDRKIISEPFTDIEKAIFLGFRKDFFV